MRPEEPHEPSLFGKTRIKYKLTRAWVAELTTELALEVACREKRATVSTPKMIRIAFAQALYLQETQGPMRLQSRQPPAPKRWQRKGPRQWVQ
jgi:hypothetical protein